jgi:hypothetical protein
VETVDGKNDFFAFFVFGFFCLGFWGSEWEYLLGWKY